MRISKPLSFLYILFIAGCADNPDFTPDKRVFQDAYDSALLFMKKFNINTLDKPEKSISIVHEGVPTVDNIGS
jgi:hypothetical protein